jgi:hypothetical protein
MMLMPSGVLKRICEFEILTNSEDIGADTMNTLLVDAGIRTGIGDWRPEKKGKYGKFFVTKFQEIKG